VTPLVLALLADRSAPPAVDAPAILEQPADERFALSAAVDVALVRVPGVRMVEIAVRVHHGSWALAGGPTEGVRALGWLQDSAAGPYDAAELSTLADLHEVDVWSGIDHEWSDVRLSVPLEDLAVGAELLGLVVREPSFPRSELALYQRDLRLFYEVEGPNSPDALARAALAYAWFPSNTPYGRRPSLDDLADVRRRDLRELHARWFASAPATVLVVGDVDRAAVEPLLRDALAGLGAPSPRAAPPASEPPPSGVVGVDLPGQAQASLRLRLPWPDRDHADRAAAYTIQQALGGFFLSRLNLVLREQKGWTYGVGAGWVDAPGRAFLTLSVDVPAEVAAEARTEIEQVLALMAAEGPTDQERADAALAAVQDWNGMMETASTAMAARLSMLTAGDDIAAARERLVEITALDAPTARAAAAAWLRAEGPRLWVVVGDRGRLEPELADFGPVRWGTAARVMLGDLP
jgi:zinc protease